MMALHYRLSLNLRDSTRFLNVQKKSKSKQLFLIQGISKTDNFAIFVKDFDMNSFQNVFSACVDEVKVKDGAGRAKYLQLLESGGKSAT